MMIIMNRLLAIPAFLFVFSMGLAYAEPLDETNVVIQEYDGNSVTVQVIWNHDKTVAKYEVGCVSCIPNTSEFTSEDSIVLDNITPFPNTANAMLYLIAYDFQDEIINAKQMLVSLEQ